VISPSCYREFIGDTPPCYGRVDMDVEVDVKSTKRIPPKKGECKIFGLLLMRIKN